MSQEKKFSRRGFLQAGVSGMAGVLAGPALIMGRAKDTLQEGSKSEILRRKMGKTGLEVAVLGLGCGYLTESALVRAALDKGIDYIDSAYAYMNGRSDEAIGKIIKDVKRDSIVITTKVDMPQEGRTGLYRRNIKSDEFIRRAETSLSRMNIDYADIIAIHDLVRAEDVAFEPLVTALQRLKKDGKARAIGIAFHRNEPAILDAMASCGLYDIAVVSYNFRQPHVDQVRAAIAKAGASGLGIVAMKTMAGVFFDRERKRPVPGRAAAKWALQDENVATVIPGFTTFEQLEDDAAILRDIQMTDVERDSLGLDEDPLPDGLYCAQCGTCRTECPSGLDIPTVMRAYMYAYGYRNPGLARTTAAEAGATEAPCADCGTCRVRCPMGFRVNERLGEMARLAALPAGMLG